MSKVNADRFDKYRGGRTGIPDSVRRERIYGCHLRDVGAEVCSAESVAPCMAALDGRTANVTGASPGAKPRYCVPCPLARTTVLGEGKGLAPVFS